MSVNLIELKNVSYRYPDGTCALSDCSMTIECGTKTAVMGSNGSGKTTLFLHLNGLLRPLKGELFFDGLPFEYGRAGLQALRSKVGLVFQNPDSQLFSACVREDVSFGPMNLGLSEAIVRQRVESALQAVGMVDSADRPVHNLSYGQKKRVCIAGVLAMQPQLLVLDEPMAGLDSAMQRELAILLDQLHEAGMTIIIATHDLDFAYGWADRTVALHNGSLLAEGATTEVMQLPDVQRELGGEPYTVEIIRSLSLFGIDLRDKGTLPRTRSELMQAIRNFQLQEQTL